MKKEIEKLIFLLRLCSDDETEAIKLQFLVNIISSDDYLAFSKSAALKNPFEELYELSKLEVLSNSELKKRRALLHNIVYFNNQLVKSIHFGNGPELTDNDLPDYTSLKSITQLCNKIHISNDVTNYTNISEENALAVFSDTTIKSAQKCFDMLPISVAKADVIDEAMIIQNMGTTLFCINIEEFETCRKNFLVYTEKCENIIADENLRRKKHRLFKIAIVMLCFAVIYTCSQFGLFLDTFTPMLTFIMFFISILFLIWG